MCSSVVSNYCFGEDDNLLGDEKRAAVQRKNMVELLLGIKINLHFPWIFDLLDLIPFYLAKNIMPPGVHDMVALSQVGFLNHFPIPSGWTDCSVECPGTHRKSSR